MGNHTGGGPIRYQFFKKIKKKIKKELRPRLSARDPITPLEKDLLCVPSGQGRKGCLHNRVNPLTKSTLDEKKRHQTDRKTPASPHRTTQAARASLTTNLKKKPSDSEEGKEKEKRNTGR